MNIPLNKPGIGREEEEQVIKVLRSGNLLLGDKVKTFENNFAEYLGVKHAVATSSGTTALNTALIASGIKKGDEVITTPFSFIATANSILHVGARPIFVDIEEDTFNLNPELIAEKITKKTKVILPVSLYGHPCDIEQIRDIANQHKLKVIEDCAQAHGSEIKGKKVGSFSTSTFSFDPTKNITTAGGGVLVTNEDEIAEVARMLRVHGAKTPGMYDILGYNFKMNDISAAIGIEQLKKLDQFVEKRINNARYLTAKLSDIDWLLTPKTRKNNKHTFHKYTTRIIGKERGEVIKKLNEAGIGNKVFYPMPIHKQKLYSDLGYNDKLPVVEKLANEVLSLPIHPNIKKEDLDYISKALHEI